MNEEDRCPKTPRAKLSRITKSAPIAVFLRDTFFPFIRKKYRKHKWQIIALGKHWCVKQRREGAFSCESNVFVQRDYTDRIPCEYNYSAMSTGMGGGNANVGMEGFFYQVKEGENEMRYHWHGYLSDEKQQDARTSYVNADRFISHQQTLGRLGQGTRSTLYLQNDGCVKQYKSGTALYMTYHLSNAHGININCSITCAHHGKSTVDALAGGDKHFLRNGYIRGIDSTMVDESWNVMSEAKKAAKWLSSPDRCNGLRGDTKHRLSEDTRNVSTRTYEVTEYSLETPIPMANCTFCVKEGLYIGTTANNDKNNNGIHEMFNYYFSPGMTRDTCAVRRIPCLCDACNQQLSEEWKIGGAYDKTPGLQPRFASREDCILQPMMGTLNEWRILTLAPTKIIDLNEINMFKRDILKNMEDKQFKEIDDKKFGAYKTGARDVTEGFYLVKWIAKPYILQQPQTVEGCGGTPMQRGTKVCKGRFWNKIRRAPGWYMENEGDEIYLFWIRYVLCGDVDVVPYDNTTGQDPPEGGT